MSDPPPPVGRHEATDRFGKTALGAAHRLGAAMVESGAAGEEPILVRTRGPHRTLTGLAAAIDAALADEERGDEERGDEERGDEERGDEERGNGGTGDTASGRSAGHTDETGTTASS